MSNENIFQLIGEAAEIAKNAHEMSKKTPPNTLERFQNDDNYAGTTVNIYNMSCVIFCHNSC